MRAFRIPAVFLVVASLALLGCGDLATPPNSDELGPPLLMAFGGIPVDIDIKPGSDPNSINTRTKGVIPVAILTTASFDAAEVAPGTVTLGDDDGDDTRVATRKNGSLRANLADVDGDGDLDMILHFDTQALVANGDLTTGTTELILNGEQFDGTPIKGSDAVRVVR